MSEAPTPTLDDALYLLELHRRTGCLHYAEDAATDYAGRILMKEGHINYARVRLGFQYVINGLDKADKKRKAES